MVKIFRPDGHVTQPGHTLASGRRLLRGARIGILDNCKPNARLIMVSVADQLAERTGAHTTLVLTKNAARPAEAEVIDQLRSEVDLVFTGSAD
jgi:hypothetical protein